jgi:selenocysteine lyase/cysteine desulfurase
MRTRRQLLAELSAPAAAAAAVALLHPGRARAALAAVAGERRGPDELAGDESFWFEVQQAFAVDRSLINLNNGGVSPSPAVVQAAMRRHLDYSNAAPAYTMWTVLEPQREPVRQRLAALLGCDGEEVALTRNASEGLEICQLGLDLAAGDEVVASDQDYPRMLTTWRQRERRDGIVLRTFPLPPPTATTAEVVAAFAGQMSERTRAVLVSHVVNLTGRVLPVREVVAMARARGVPAIVDGAHSFAHFPFTRDDLDCDYFATSLHKWLFAPHGTGMLYVRRDRIAGLWPLMPAPAELDRDVRKFEEIGTHPAANHLAIAEALTFHEGIRGGAQGGPPAAAARPLGAAARRPPRRAPPHQPRARALRRHRHRPGRGHRPGGAHRPPVGTPPHPGDDHLPPGGRGDPRHAQRLHHARGDRPLPGGPRRHPRARLLVKSAGGGPGVPRSRRCVPPGSRPSLSSPSTAWPWSASSPGCARACGRWPARRWSRRRAWSARSWSSPSPSRRSAG